MKVLYILNSTTITGGATKSLLTLLQGLKEKGITPFVVVPDGGDLCKVLKDKGITYFVLRYSTTTYPSLSSSKDKLLFLPRIFRWKLWESNAVSQIKGIIKEYNIDLVHTNVSVETVGLRAAYQMQVPHIMHFREYADIDFDMHYYPSKKKYYSLLNKFGTYTISITKGIQMYHNLYGERHRQIYNGIELDKNLVDNNDKHILCSESYFLFAGRVEPAKGLKQVVEAFAIFYADNKDKAIHLKVAGSIADEEYAESIRNLISKYELSEVVKFLGPRHDIADLMSKSIATIVSSNFEAFGRCLPEAMLNRCLTIGKDTAGTKEQYDNGLNLYGEEIGLRYNTTEDLAQIMKIVSNMDKQQYASMVSRAENTVLQLYNAKKYVSEVYDFYKEIINKNK